MLISMKFSSQTACDRVGTSNLNYLSKVNKNFSKKLGSYDIIEDKHKRSSEKNE